MPLLFALLLSACVILIAVTVVWLLALHLKDNSIMDIWYGPICAIATLVLILTSSSPHPVAFLFLMLLLVWSLRLAIRIARKNIGKGEDVRYRVWRELWMQKGYRYFMVRSYLQVFVLQGAVIYAVLMPVILIVGAGGATYPLVVLAGVALWCLGLFFEVAADHQLDVFIRNPNNQGKIMRSGLFRYSRRPNYFGEAVMWWGIATIALGSIPFPIALVALLSPVTITYIVYVVTGPQLERRWEKHLVYQEYTEQTNYFFPWFPRIDIPSSR